jgi:hypothetical protein
MQNVNLTAVETRQPLGRFNDGSHRPLMAMVEITNRCNMACPLCFTRAGNTAVEVSLEEVKTRLDNLLAVAGSIPVQISGGEPTLHQDLPEIIHYARQLGFTNIELITNGIRLSREKDYLSRLVDQGLTSVYLQFDGLEKNTYEALRGQDMTEVRERSITAIRREQLCCTLAIAVAPGVNDHELGNIVRFGIANIDTVRAINFQSAARFTGRYEIAGASSGYSLSSLIELIEVQSHIEPGGFASDILGHPKCNGMSLVYIIDGALKPLFKYLTRDRLINYLGKDKRTKILDLFSGRDRYYRKYLADPKAWKLLLEAAAIFGDCPSMKSILSARHILLFAKSFMEKKTLHPARVEQCNYAIAETDGVYSFCAYNNLYRFESKK